MFFTFVQNNSYGTWEGPMKVCIEADNAEEANVLAVDKADIYFDGISNGHDCGCCGDRWNPVDDDDGYDVPSIYGEPAEGDEDPKEFVIFYKKKEEKKPEKKNPETSNQETQMKDLEIQPKDLETPEKETQPKDPNFWEFMSRLTDIFRELLKAGILENSTAKERRRISFNTAIGRATEAALTDNPNLLSKDSGCVVLVFHADWNHKILDHLFPMMSELDLGLREDNFEKGLDAYRGSTPPQGIFFSFEDVVGKTVFSARFFPGEKYTVGGETLKDYRPLVKFVWKPKTWEDT